MEHCDYCGAELPLLAQFCSNCGHTVNLPLHPFMQNTQADPQAETPTAALPDIFVPPALPAQGGFPAGNVPVVQGTPQISSTPSVQGAPPSPPAGSAAPFHNLAQAAPPSAPHQAGTPGHPAYPHSEPRQPAAQHHQQPQHGVHQGQPTQSLSHAPEHAQHGEQQRPEQHHHGQRHEHEQQAHHAHGLRSTHAAHATGASKVVAGVTAKWLVLLLVAVVVLGTSGVFLALASATPALALTGNSTVNTGAMLHIHGTGFLPGGSVTLTLDNGLPVAFDNARQEQQEQQSAPASAAAGAGASDLSRMMVSEQMHNLLASSASIGVSLTGNFDADIVAQANWPAGKHIIHATEGFGSRSASLSFTILAVAAHLVVTPSTLEFGTVPQGGKVSQSVLIGNTGASLLTWKATGDGSSWLKLANSAGAIPPNGAREALFVTVDTTGLKPGDYTASIQVHSSQPGDDKQVAVHVKVGPQAPQEKKVARLVVNPQSLDFGQLSAGQQVINTVTISNQGTLALSWQVSAGSTSWLTLPTTSGSILPGALPQSIQVIANTSDSSLQTGSNTATITITSNGGTVTLPVALTLTAPPVTVTPTTPTIPPSPTTPPPILSGSPGSFNVPGDPNCSYNAASGWSCTATLNSVASNQGILNWTASASGLSGVSFSSQTGTLTPGSNAPVTISIPNTACPASATFTFQGPANPIIITWNCAAPTLATSTASINASTNCTYSNGWTCPITLNTASGDQGQLNWTSSSSGISGISITPSGGAITAGQPAPVSIFVPTTTCPASASVTFAGTGSNSVTVAWSCAAPQLLVNTSNINANTDCTWLGGASSPGWQCSVTLSTDPTAQTSLNWTATASSNFNGVGLFPSFNPASGSVSPGTPVQVGVVIGSNSHASCPASGFTGTLTFTGPANAVNVSWSCTVPTLLVTPASINGDTDCTYAAGSGWTCTVTLTQQSQGYLNWSTSSSGINGITFNPDVGAFIVPPTPQQVTVTIPDTVCPASATLTFIGSNTVNVLWSCSAPTIVANITSGGICPTDPNSGNYICTDTVSLAPGSEGDLPWSASSDIAGVTFSPQTSTLVPGQTQTVTITVPAATCPGSGGTFSFAGQSSNTATITFSCTSSIGSRSGLAIVPTNVVHYASTRQSG